MNISRNEAEEALAAIQQTMQRTRHAIAGSGVTLTLIVTGVVWLIGFLCTQFLPATVAGYVWAGLSVVGTAAGTVLGFRLGKRVRSPATAPMVRRVLLFWLFLVLFGVAGIGVARPTDGRQATMLVILFIMLGQMAMGLLFSFASTWWALPVTALALIGYFLLPGIFYLWMGVLGGGGMIALGVVIHRGV